MLYQIAMAAVLLLSPGPRLNLESLLREHGWGPMERDAALTQAALEMAQLFGASARGGDPESAGGHLRFVLEKNGVSDAHVVPFTVRHEGNAEASQHFPKLLSRLERRLAPTHIGLGSHKGTDGWTTTILLVHRGATMEEPLPRTAAVGQTLRVSALIRRGYFRSRLLLGAPNQAVVQESPAFQKDRRLEVDVHFNAGPGRYALEIVAESQYGPVVLNKSSVYVGVEPPRLPLVRLRPPVGSAQVEDPAERLISMVNAHRVSHQVAPLKWTESLARVSRQHAREMSERRVLAHGSPNTGNLVTRLRTAGVEATAVAENLAEASDEASAFRAFLGSPGHARNLLLPGMTHIGIGVVGRYYALTLVRLDESVRAPAQVVPGLH